MALLDIELHFVFETIGLEEAVHGRDVVVILVLRRFLRFGSTRIVPLKPILCLYSTTICSMRAHLVELALQVGVEQRFIALASAPQNIVLAAELHRGVHAVLMVAAE